MKDFKTYDEQIDLLKTRGLIINNKAFALEKLKEENYYNIVNGYKYLFITPGTTDNFISGTTFEEIYGFVPLWVLVNAISLGRLSQFYSLMNQSIRIKVAMHWNIKEDDLNQYIKTLAFYRNLCAHDERIYNSRCSQDIPDSIIHNTLNINNINGRYSNGKNDLFSLIIVLKVLLPEGDFTNMCNKIDGRMRSLSEKITHISYLDIFNVMGFPTNWIQIKTA